MGYVSTGLQVWMDEMKWLVVEWSRMEWMLFDQQFMVMESQQKVWRGRRVAGTQVKQNVQLCSDCLRPDQKLLAFLFC